MKEIAVDLMSSVHSVHVSKPTNSSDLIVRTNSRYTCFMIVVNMEDTNIFDALHAEIIWIRTGLKEIDCYTGCYKDREDKGNQEV